MLRELATLHTKAHAQTPGEVDLELPIREGELPRWLEGVLFRNGPGRQSAFGVPYKHPFDGDGMILRFSFEGGKVRYKNRFVRTRAFEEEERAGKMLYRSFGTNLPGGLAKNLLRTTFKNAANTSVVLHGGKLLALWEGGVPHALDPETLRTLGPHDFEGRLQNRLSWLDAKMSPHLPFSAHPKRCPDTSALYGFGTLYGRKNHLVLYRVDRSGVMDEPELVELPKLTFLHDFVVTKRYRIVFDVPTRFAVARTLLGFVPPVDAIDEGEGDTIVRLFPKARGERPLTFTLPSAFVFHFVNGFERDDGTLVVEGIRTASFPRVPGADVLASGAPFYPAPVLTRFELDPRTGKATQAAVSRTPCELPTIDPREVSREHTQVFAIAGPELADGDTHVAPFFSRIVRFDRATGRETVRDLGHALVGEPVYVPVRGDGEGVVLTVVFEGAREKSALYVLAAKTLETVAVCELPHGLPAGFHGTWVPSAGDA